MSQIKDMNGLFILSLLSAAIEPSTVKGYLITGRIVGGEVGDIHSFPFMVNIQMQSEGEPWRQHCGGSIVSQTLILTACHCINENVSMNPIVLLDPQNLRIVAGVSDVNQQSPHRQDLTVRKVIPHPKCKNTADAAYFSDSALLILERPLVYSSKVQPLKLFDGDPSKAMQEQQNLIDKGASCTIAGWGSTTADQEDDVTKLRTAKVILMTPQQCKTTFCNLKAKKFCSRNFSELKQFCAIGSNNSSFCFGDSGGPIICNGTVLGTVSYTSRNCPVDWPGVYTSSEVIVDMITSYNGTLGSSTDE